MTSCTLMETRTTHVRIAYVRGGPRFVFVDPSGEGLPLACTRRSYRQAIYRDPLDPRQTSDALPREWVRLAARHLIGGGTLVKQTKGTIVESEVIGRERVLRVKRVDASGDEHDLAVVTSEHQELQLEIEEDRGHEIILPERAR